MKKQSLNLMMAAGIFLLVLIAMTANAEEKSPKTTSSDAGIGISMPKSPQAQVKSVKKDAGTPKADSSQKKRNSSGTAVDREQTSKTDTAGTVSGGNQNSLKTTAVAQGGNAGTKPRQKAKQEDIEVDGVVGDVQVTKSESGGAINWITMLFTIAGFAATAALLVLVFLMRKRLEMLADSVAKNAGKTNNLEKSFGTKVRDAVAEAVREKNPILKEYDDLRKQNTELRGALEECRKDLSESRTEFNKAQQEISRLKEELANTRSQLEKELANTKATLSETQKKLEDCSGALDEEKKTTESLRTQIAVYVKFIGKTVLELTPDEGLAKTVPEDRIILLALAKMDAMHEAKVDARDILREFQSFDSQLNMIIHNQIELQETRDAIKTFVEPLLDNKYRISWPKVGSSISEYKQDEELDLDESESGTTIKEVKSATIRFADADGAAFQKAKVICG